HERLAAGAADAPERCLGNAFRLDLWKVDRLAAEAAVGCRLEPAGSASPQSIGEVELAAGGAAPRLPFRQRPGDESPNGLVPRGPRAEMRGEMQRRTPTARHAHEIAA